LTLRQGSGQAWTGDVIGFWFGLQPEQWWKADEAVDSEVRERFEELWEDQRQLPAKSFLTDPHTALAAVILFDQFPRNMFRGHADQYSTDSLALAVAKGAVDRGLDEQLQPSQRGILYMPFQHSEELDDQRRSLLLFTALGNEEQLRFARLHHDVIERFGRFPHRNVILGRTPRPEEVAAGDVVPW
jgi:uncharacterized protein (DUF924 family)